MKKMGRQLSQVQMINMGLGLCLTSLGACGDEALPALEMEAATSALTESAVDEGSTAASTATNLVRNGSFSVGLSSWIPNIHTGVGTIGVEDVGGTHAQTATFDNPTVMLAYQLQIYQDGIPIKAGHCYRVSFAAKAREPRAISVGMGKNAPDWRSYGLWFEPTLPKKWAVFSTTFVATANAKDTRFSFNFGTADTISWLDDVKLQDLGVKSPCS